MFNKKIFINLFILIAIILKQIQSEQLQFYPEYNPILTQQKNLIQHTFTVPQELYNSYFKVKLISQTQNIVKYQDTEVLVVVSSFPVDYSTKKNIIEESEENNKLKDQFVFFDIDAYYQKLDQHYIKVPPLSQNFNNLNLENTPSITLTLAVFIQNLTTAHLKYEIIIEPIESNFCVDGCISENQGQCGFATKFQCKCQKITQFGSDCSGKAQILAENKQYSQPIKYLDWSYFYLNLEISDFDYEIILDPKEHRGGISFYFKDFSRGTKPSFETNYYEQPPSQDKIIFHLSQDYLKTLGNTKNITLILGYFQKSVIDEESQQQNNQISVIYKKLGSLDQQNSFDSWGTAVYIVLGFFALFFLMLIAFQCVKCYCLSISKTRVGNREGQQGGQRRNNSQSQQQQSNKKKKDKKITKETIEKYIPIQPYKNYQEKLENQNDLINECPICLVGFKEKSKVRMSICNHIFHPKCIEKWLLSNETCPNCRQSFEKDQILEYLKNSIRKNTKILQKELPFSTNNNNNLSVLANYNQQGTQTQLQVEDDDCEQEENDNVFDIEQQNTEEVQQPNTSINQDIEQQQQTTTTNIQTDSSTQQLRNNLFFRRQPSNNNYNNNSIYSLSNIMGQREDWDEFNTNPSINNINTQPSNQNITFNNNNSYQQFNLNQSGSIIINDNSMVGRRNRMWRSRDFNLGRSSMTLNSIENTSPISKKHKNSISTASNGTFSSQSPIHSGSKAKAQKRINKQPSIQIHLASSNQQQNNLQQQQPQPQTFSQQAIDGGSRSSI